MTDAALIDRTLAGDKEAFGNLVDRYRHQVYALAHHHVGDFEAAKDVAQEAFVQAYLKLKQLRDPGKFHIWLRKLTINISRMWLRQREVRVVPLDVDHEDSQYLPGSQNDIELNLMVRQAIERLPERQRLAVNMFYIDGLSYEEIGKFLGESVGAVESRLHRARSRLRERMMDMIGETFKAHHLSKRFRDEVLTRVRIVGAGGTVEELARQLQSSTPRPSAVLLKDEQRRALPISLSAAEAISIAMQLEAKPPPRPMTYDLFKRILETLEIRLERVVLSKAGRDRLIVRMEFVSGNNQHSIESEADDGLAMAVRTNAEIFATSEVVGRARIQKSSTRAKRIVSPSDKLPALLGPQFANPAEKRRYEEEMQSLLRQRLRRWKKTKLDKRTIVRVQEIKAEPKNAVRIVLSDANGWRLPLWVGYLEGQAIAQALKNGRKDVRFPLPSPRKHDKFPHDLIKSTMNAFGVHVTRVAIDALMQTTFLSVVHMRRGAHVFQVDARPSDAIALALRFDSPITINRKVMKYSGAAPGKGLATPVIL